MVGGLLAGNVSTNCSLASILGLMVRGSAQPADCAMVQTQTCKILLRYIPVGICREIDELTCDWQVLNSLVTGKC